MTDVLWASFGNVVHAAKEGDALLSALAEMLAEGALSTHFIDIASEDYSTWEDEADWVVTYYLKDWKLKARPRNTSAGLLTIALSFWRPEDERGDGWDGCRSAKLYVGYSRRRKRVWDWDTLVLDGSGRSAHAKPASEFLWVSAAEDQPLGSWFFCARAIDLQSRDDLSREVVEPLARLLADPSAADAFARTASTLRTPLAPNG